MTAPDDHDHATLDRALMRSGLVRTIGLLVVLAIGFVAMWFRRASFNPDHQAMFTAGPMTLMLLLVCYEVAMLVRVRRGLAHGTVISSHVWAMNACVECSLPTLAIWFVWQGGMLPPDEALVAPAMIAYGFFIILSILHVQPWLVTLTGALCAGGHFGLVVLARAQGAFDYSPDVIPFATLLMYPVTIALCGICAIFVSLRVRRYVEAAVTEGALRERAEREIRAASDVQRSVLPESPPNLTGYTIAGWTRPAEQAGGDYYDWAELPDAQVVVSIADVAGHGLGPALITAYCRAYARSAIDSGQHLDEAFTRINALVCRDLPPGRFVTIAAVRLTANSPDAALLSAGHGPILQYHAQSRAVTAFDADDIPLGIVPDLRFETERTLRLEAGDALILITDGFFEWSNESGEDWGIGRLQDAVVRAAEKDPGAMIESLVRDVEAFAGGAPQIDDLTVVVIRRDP